MSCILRSVNPYTGTIFLYILDYKIYIGPRVILFLLHQQFTGCMQTLKSILTLTTYRFRSNHPISSQTKYQQNMNQTNDSFHWLNFERDTPRLVFYMTVNFLSITEKCPPEVVSYTALVQSVSSASDPPCYQIWRRDDSLWLKVLTLIRRPSQLKRIVLLLRSHLKLYLLYYL